MKQGLQHTGLMRTTMLMMYNITMYIFSVFFDFSVSFYALRCAVVKACFHLINYSEALCHEVERSAMVSASCSLL